MSSHDGSRSVRQSKRYSVTALYLSMSAKDKELEIEDDLARGMSAMFKSFRLGSSANL
jgi:Ras GTPase-activating-like protein IQGAP2/3